MQLRNILRDVVICGLFAFIVVEKLSVRQQQQQQQQQQQRRKAPPSQQVAGLSQAAIQQFCPFARCSVTKVCHPCKRRYLIVIAQGRSASTTLQNMFHSLPGLRMSGENNNMLGNFMIALDATRNLRVWQSGSFRARRHKAWGHEPVVGSDFACVTQQMVETINPPPRKNKNNNNTFAQNNDDDKDDDDDDSETIVGFKTIRFVNNIKSAVIMNDGNGIDDNHQFPLEQAANFLTESFPCSKVIINIRSDVSEQSMSMKKTLLHKNKDKDVQDILKDLEHNNELLLRLAKHLGPQRAHVLDSSDWTTNVTAINQVVSWLGFAKACHFTELFQFNVEGRGFDVGDVTGRSTPAGCHKLVSTAAAAVAYNKTDS